MSGGSSLGQIVIPATALRYFGQFIFRCLLFSSSKSVSAAYFQEWLVLCNPNEDKEERKAVPAGEVRLDIMFTVTSRSFPSPLVSDSEETQCVSHAALWQISGCTRSLISFSFDSQVFARSASSRCFLPREADGGEWKRSCCESARENI